MNYEIITSRWVCPECGGPLRLSFAQVAEIEGEAPSEELSCQMVLCAAGHQIPEETSQEAMANADQEFNVAMQDGFKVAEVWWAPTPKDESPNESLPPEE